MDIRLVTHGEFEEFHEEFEALDERVPQNIVTPENIDNFLGDYAQTEQLETHAAKTPAAAGGAHGVRAANGKIEIYDGTEWVNMQKAYTTYGVSIDLTDSNPETSVTYTDDAVGMVAGSNDWLDKPIFNRIRPCLLKNGVVNYYLDPDDFTKKQDGTTADITSGDDGNVMIEFPRMGFRIAKSSNTLTVQITDDPNADGFSYDAFARGDVIKNHLYVGAYIGSIVAYSGGGALASLSGQALNSSNFPPIQYLRQFTHQFGTGYDMLSFYPLTLLQCLYLIMYKNLNSSGALGLGYVDANNANCAATGGTNNKGMCYGDPNDGKKQVKFLGIEDFWGNFSVVIDGIMLYSSGDIMTATKDFNDNGQGYQSFGQISNIIAGIIKRVMGTSQLGFIIAEPGASRTTYFCDDGTLLKMNNTAYCTFSKPYNSSHAGVFGLSMTTTDLSMSTGISRLMYL